MQAAALTLPVFYSDLSHFIKYRPNEREDHASTVCPKTEPSGHLIFAHGPLLRATLLRLAQHEQQLLLVLATHH